MNFTLFKQQGLGNNSYLSNWKRTILIREHIKLKKYITQALKCGLFNPIIKCLCRRQLTCLWGSLRKWIMGRVFFFLRESNGKICLEHLNGSSEIWLSYCWWHKGIQGKQGWTFGCRQIVLHAGVFIVQILTAELGVNRAMVWSWTSSCLDWLSEDSGENPIWS